jgi:hypothetical protein
LKKNIVSLFSLLLLSGCIVINNYPNGKPPVAKRHAGAPSKDIIFGTAQADVNPSLFFTMIDKKDKTIANCHLESRQDDNTTFSVELEDYEQTEILHLEFDVSDRAFGNIKTSSLKGDSYRLVFPGKDTSSVATFSNIHYTAYHDSLMYVFSGEMNSKGKTYDFYGQSDPWPLFQVFMMGKLLSTLESEKETLLNFCKTRQARVQLNCKHKVTVIKKFNKPLFEVGNIPIGADMISDCDVRCLDKK